MSAIPLRKLLMALKIILPFFLILLFIYYSRQDQPSTDPHYQKLTMDKYSPDEHIHEHGLHDKGQETKESFDDVMLNVDKKKDIPAMVHLSVVACGDRFPETVVLLKSAVLFSSPATRFHFHIFTETQLETQFRDALRSWPPFVASRFAFTIHPITFPETEDFKTWKNLFKPCASQRLFFPNIFPELELLLYVDTDILFLKPVGQIWSHFEKFNSTQLAALAPEHEDQAIGWYNRFANHPYYGKLGVNSGVMLMNLARMRKEGWEKHMIQFQEEYKKKIVWGDQDLINIYFSKYPEKLFVYPCQWNYRPDHCMYMQNCHTAVEEGVAVLHGNRRVFHNEKQPAFKAVYNAISDFSFQNGDPQKDVIDRLEKELKVLKENNCAMHGNTFLKALRTSIQNVPTRMSDSS